MTTVSARPDNLAAYQSKLEESDRNLRSTAGSLFQTLETYRTSCPQFGADHTELAYSLGAHASAMEDLDGWVGRVGETFRRADRAPGPVPVGVVLTTEESVKVAEPEFEKLDGDLAGAGLSLLSMLPWAGDAIAKPLKFFRKIVKYFPALKRLDNGEAIPDLMKHLDWKNPLRLNRALSTLASLQRKAELAYKNADWLKKARRLELPTEGGVPFIPPKDWDVKFPRMEKVGVMATWTHSETSGCEMGMDGSSSPARDSSR